MKQVPRVGFVGLGDMGGAIAGRIMSAGFPVTLWARREVSYAQFAPESFRRARDLEDLGRSSDIVGVCVFGDDDVRQIVLAEGGLLSAMGPGGILLIHSTVSVQTCLEIAHAAAHRIEVLDAPVSGQREEALRGRLVLMVGGDPVALERSRPVIESYGNLVRRMGPVGSGQTMKLLNNVLAFATGSLAIDAIETAQSLGLDAKAVMDVLCAGGARSMALISMVEKLVPNPDFCRHASSLMEKDARLFSEIRERAQLPRGVLEELAYARVRRIVPNL